MGGIGSGEWSRWNVKNTTNGSRNFDIRILHRKGGLVPGYSGIYSWDRDGEPWGSIQYKVEERRVVLDYRYQAEEDWEDIQEPVQLTWTPCNFGGERPWVLCPAIGCGRRVAVLYGTGKYFACRHCYDLAYLSQRECRYGRASRKFRNIIKRLGGDPNDQFWPQKPKHMHWKTYNRLVAQADHYDQIFWQALNYLR